MKKREKMKKGGRGRGGNSEKEKKSVRKLERRVQTRSLTGITQKRKQQKKWWKALRLRWDDTSTSTTTSTKTKKNLIHTIPFVKEHMTEKV